MMMGVIGIGGLFFRSDDPEALGAWYRTRLNVGRGCMTDAAQTPNEWTWQAQGGDTAFEPFARDSDYFPLDRAFMLNLRVVDLDAVLAPFHAAGEEVITKAEWDEMGLGRFARVHDPEGNPIELWEPAAE
jgi:predicted enzyme related to lactoylglutathione lyase